MTPFRFIHTSDLHLGKRFASLPDENARARLAEARHGALERLAFQARDNGSRHILVAGDLFDTSTPSRRVVVQAINAMARASDLCWWILPGNHDSLAAEALWASVTREAPATVRVIAEPAPLEIAPGVVLLPAPLAFRRAATDPTAWMARATTPEGALRIGLAHGSVVAYGSEPRPDLIEPDRAVSAGLDYLAIGDRHGPDQVGPRTWYCGAPERDGFDYFGRGSCLGVTLRGPGAAPEVETIEVGAFDWRDAVLPLVPGEDAAAAFAALLPPDPLERRDVVLRVRATGRVMLADRARLSRAADDAAAHFCHFDYDDDELVTDYAPVDLDAIALGGGLRLAADALKAAAEDERAVGEERAVAAAALNRLYGYVRGVAR